MSTSDIDSGGYVRVPSAREEEQFGILFKLDSLSAYRLALYSWLLSLLCSQLLGATRAQAQC